MELNSLPRKLAERLTLDVAELPDRTSPDDWPEAMLITDSELRQMAEAVIREAIDKTIEAAEKVICYGCEKEIPLDPSGTAILMHVDPHSGGMLVCQAAAIRSLKQSNSGRAERIEEPMWVGYPSTACLLPDVELGRPERIEERPTADAELAELLNMLMATNVHGAILQLRDHLDGDKRLLDNYQRLYKFRRGQS